MRLWPSATRCYRVHCSGAHRILAFAGALAIASCSGREAQPYSERAGSVDAAPKTAFGDPLEHYPPEVDGGRADLSEGRGIQAFADNMIGERVAEFVAQHVAYSRTGVDFHYFYPEPQAGPGPGLCQARVYSVVSPNTETAVPRGQWLNQVYAIAGSVEPLPEPRPASYRARLNAACRDRRDMAMWYHAEPSNAYLAARLADVVVASSRRAGSLPFDLLCVPFPTDIPFRSACAENVRQVVTSINPRAIVEVRDCHFQRDSRCLAIAMAKTPESAHSAAEEQWTLEVVYGEGPVPEISSVHVVDTHIIID